MLKWKQHKFADIDGPKEDLNPILSGMAGKNRVIKFIAFPLKNNLHARIYRDAEQIVNFHTYLLDTFRPILAMDLPLAEGQICNAGFFMLTGTATTPTIAIGYEETD